MPLLISTIFASSADAQIINTLRGFDDAEQGWSGGVEGTFTVASGNSEYDELEFGAAIQLQSDRNRWRLIGRSLRLKASGKRAADNQLVHLRHNYRFLRRLASVVFFQGQHDPFRRVETRILLGVGARTDVVGSDILSAALGTTIMREDEKLTGVHGGFTTTHRFSFFLSLTRNVKAGITADITAFYQPVIDDFADARALTTASFRADLTGNLYFLMGYGLEYDAKPPLDVKRIDQRMRSGLGYKF